MTITIQEVIAQIPAWAGKSASVEPLSGGLSNSNYRAVIDGKSSFVRIPGTGTELLAVDRVNERYNSRIAGETGVKRSRTGWGLVHFSAFSALHHV